MSEQDEIIKQAKDIVAVAEKESRVGTIASDTDYSSAGELIRLVKSKQGDIKALFEKPKKLAQEAHKAVVAAEKSLIEPLDAIISEINGKMIAYRSEQEKRRAEEARIAQEALRKQAEEERRRRAEEAEVFGSAEEARVIAAAPVVVPEVVMPPAAPKVSGISYRKDWKARVTDLNLVPREYLIVDEKKLGALARALKESARVPGVEFYAEEVMVAR